MRRECTIEFADDAASRTSPRALSLIDRSTSMTPPRAPSLVVRGLKVELPGGQSLIEDLSLELHPGEVAVILGGSGSGKSTFSRVLFEPDVLRQQGFHLHTEELTFNRLELGLVPQRGALFDHLDVRGNLELAMRYAQRDGAAETAGTWLERVGLDESLAERGVSVGSLSGGQAQRVAVARVLAGGRRVLILDEPSVGLDPHHVRVLARLLRRQCEGLGVAIVVVTHDVSLAGGVGDRLFMLDPLTRRLELLFEGEWQGPFERGGLDESRRGYWMLRLEDEIVRRIETADRQKGATKSRGRSPSPRRLKQSINAASQPFAMASVALRHIPRHLGRRPRDFLAVARRVAQQTLVRPLPFYLIVSVLIGYTLLYVITKVGGAGVRPDALLKQIGGSYIVALAPALSAVLFVAASGSATNAWLGSMGLTQQTVAMEALGVDTRAYLNAPVWLASGLSYHIVAVAFAFGMLLGGLALCSQYGLAGGWDLLTADFLDPRPERLKFVVRAAFLVWIYGWGISSDVLAKGLSGKRTADDVTRGMTNSVVACTLWVVAWELMSVLVVFAL